MPPKVKTLASPTTATATGTRWTVSLSLTGLPVRTATAKGVALIGKAALARLVLPNLVLISLHTLHHHVSNRHECVLQFNLIQFTRSVGIEIGNQSL